MYNQRSSDRFPSLILQIDTSKHLSTSSFIIHICLVPFNVQSISVRLLTTIELVTFCVWERLYLWKRLKSRVLFTLSKSTQLVLLVFFCPKLNRKSVNINMVIKNLLLISCVTTPFNPKYTCFKKNKFFKLLNSAGLKKTYLLTCANQFFLITIIRSSTWLTLYFCWALDQLPLEIYTYFLENTSSKCTWTKITFISVTHSTNQAVGNISNYSYNFMHVNDILCRSQDPDAFHKQP